MQELQEDRVNEKVDVFSFGVVMWEIWTWAEQPYPGLGLPEIFSVSDLFSTLLYLDLDPEANSQTCSSQQAC